MKSIAIGLPLLAALCVLTACATGSQTRTSPSKSSVATPSSAQTNAPGDIPDSQAFVRFSVPGQYTVLYPEGWSQSGTRSNTIFTSNFDGEQIVSQPRVDPETAIQRMFRGVRNLHVNKRGVNVAAAFTSQSRPDAVTGRSVLLDNSSYFFVRGSRETILNLWAPAGSDNVDQWKKISESFRAK